MILCSVHIASRVVTAGFFAQMASNFDQAASATDRNGDDAKASRDFLAQNIVPTDRFLISFSVSRGLEAVVLVFVASGFMLFFPAIIVMFSRVERKMQGLIQEMSYRTNQGTAFLPFEFSPRATDGSETQTEMPIEDVRQYMIDIKSAAAIQRRRFIFVLVRSLIGLIALASQATFVAATFAFNAQYNAACGSCDASCQTVAYLIFSWYTSTPEFFPLVASSSAILPLIFSLWFMMTPEDRQLLLHPHRFLSKNNTLPPLSLRDADLRQHKERLGIHMI
jgi:hypothetical protein